MKRQPDLRQLAFLVTNPDKAEQLRVLAKNYCARSRRRSGDDQWALFRDLYIECFGNESAADNHLVYYYLISDERGAVDGET